MTETFRCGMPTCFGMHEINDKPKERKTMTFESDVMRMIETIKQREYEHVLEAEAWKRIFEERNQSFTPCSCSACQRRNSK